MQENTIENEILKMAQTNVNKKIIEEKIKLENKFNSEIEDVKFILELINKKMLYKKDKKGYELITSEIFLKDYLEKETKYTWQRKLEITEPTNKYADYCDSYQLQIEVNGEKYYHIGYIINDFEKELNNKINRINYMTDGLYEIKKDFEELVKQEPIIKKMIEDYYKTNEALNVSKNEI